MSGGFWGGRSTPQEPKASSVQQGLRSCLLTCHSIHGWYPSPICPEPGPLAPPIHLSSAWVSTFIPAPRPQAQGGPPQGPGSFLGTQTWLWRGSSWMAHVARTACSWALGLTKTPGLLFPQGKDAPGQEQSPSDPQPQSLWGHRELCFPVPRKPQVLFRRGRRTLQVAEFL